MLGEIGAATVAAIAAATGDASSGADVRCMNLMMQLQRDWERQGTSSGAVAAFAGWVSRHEVLVGVSDPVALTGLVHRRSPDANRIVAALLVETATGDRWARDACLHALRPLIGWTIRRVGGAEVTDDLVAEFMAEALDLIAVLAAEYSPAMVSPISRFSNRLYNRGRHRRMIRARLVNQIAFEFDETRGEDSSAHGWADAPTVDPGVELIEFLAAAVRVNAVSVEEARLVGRRALQKRHHRIVERLTVAGPHVVAAMVA